MSVASSQSAAQASMPPPALAAPFEPIRDGGGDHTDDKKKKEKRGIFGFGKKKADEQSQKEDQQQQQQPPPQQQQRKAPPPALSPSDSAPKPPEKDMPTRKKTTSPIQTDHGGYMLPSSPGRGGGLTSSPRLSSPAGSQIFERDVQESSTVLMPNSPAIPSHITTENYIPPVLDASSEAITDDHLDPDSVEIITHTSHQPAAVTVTGATGGGYDNSNASPPPSWADELALSFADRADDSASNYGSLDTTDVRRLSFISFADVVQAEQAGGSHVGGGSGNNRDSVHLAGLTSLPPSAVMNRSPSPIRSPVSSQGGGPPTASPPTSKSGSVKGLEMSPSRKPAGLVSPTSPISSHHAPLVSGELAIETMSQALRRTGSADLSGVRSLPTSPIEGPSR